jgi:ribosomal protein S18 acetylase RimI-like enzyme
VPSDERDPTFRQATARDEPFLRRMLWIAAHWRESDPRPEAVVSPELSRYADGFGRRGDRGFVATCEGSPVGAAWCRLLTAPNRGYGYVADDVPELSVAVLSQYRGRGVGGRLIDRLLTDVADDSDAVSLSVEPDNPARLLYERLGFAQVGENAGSWTMVKSLSRPERSIERYPLLARKAEARHDAMGCAALVAQGWQAEAVSSVAQPDGGA